MISYGPLVTSAVAGQQLCGSASMGNMPDMAYCGSLEATPTVLQQQHNTKYRI